MSFVTQIIAKTLTTIKDECNEHVTCDKCKFWDVCNSKSPERWDVDKMTNIVYDLGWKGREKG